MRIEVQPKESAKAFVRLEENEPMLLTTAFEKILPYIEDNRKLGYASKKRLKEDERNLLFDFIDRLNNATNHIIENG